MAGASGLGRPYRYVGAEPKQRADANVYPAEVEAALESHPRVRSSAVIGLPEVDLGNRVRAARM